jgi:hypothetical protein
VAGAGYAYISTGVNAWAADQTPLWTGLHTFGAGLAISAGQGITMPNAGWIGRGAGIERIEFYTAGYVVVMGARLGVGIATPLVKGHFYDATANISIYIETDKVDGEAHLFFLNDAQTWRAGVTANDRFVIRDVTGAQNPLIIEPGANTNSIFIASTNYVGHGTGSPDRQSHTEVSDAVTAAVTYAQRLTHVLSSGTAAAGFGVGIEFELEDAGGGMNVAATVEAIWTSPTAGAEESALIFMTADIGDDGLVERVRIDKDGHVGIGRVPNTEHLVIAVSNENAIARIETYDNSTSFSELYFRKSATDTISTKVQTGTGTILGEINFQGVGTGAVFAWGAKIQVVQTGVAGAFIPARIEINAYSITGINADQFIIWPNNNVSINIAAAAAQLHVNQSDPSGNEPVLLLDQSDVSEDFIRFIGTAAVGVLTQSIVDEGDQASETREGWLKIYVQDDGNQITDQDYFIPIYTLSA